MGQVKVKLRKPIQVVKKTAEGDTVEQLEELVFRDEVVAGDLRGIAVRDPMLFDDFLKIAGRLSGQSDLVINKLSSADAMEVVALVAGFMAGGQTAGSAP